MRTYCHPQVNVALLTSHKKKLLFAINGHTIESHNGSKCTEQGSMGYPAPVDTTQLLQGTQENIAEQRQKDCKSQMTTTSAVRCIS